MVAGVYVSVARHYSHVRRSLPRAQCLGRSPIRPGESRTIECNSVEFVSHGSSSPFCLRCHYKTRKGILLAKIKK